MGWCSVFSSTTDLFMPKTSGLIKSERLIFLSSPTVCSVWATEERKMLGSTTMSGNKGTFSDTILKDNLPFYFFVNLCLSTSGLTYLCGYDALIPFFCYHEDGLVHWIPRRAYRWYSAFWLFTKAGQRKKNISWLLTSLTLKIHHEYGAMERDSHEGVEGKCMGSSFTRSVSVRILWYRSGSEEQRESSYAPAMSNLTACSSEPSV